MKPRYTLLPYTKQQPNVLFLVFVCAQNRAGGSVYTDQMMSITRKCGDAAAEVGCNDDSCACAVGGCGNNALAPRVFNITGTAGAPIFVLLGR